MCTCHKSWKPSNVDEAKFNPLGPKSDQHQFSPNNISRSSRVKVMRITKLILNQMLSTVLKRNVCGWWGFYGFKAPMHSSFCPQSLPKELCLRATHNNLGFYCWTIFALAKVLVRLSSSAVEFPLLWQINFSSDWGFLFLANSPFSGHRFVVVSVSQIPSF